jgi:TIR domain
VLLRRTEAEGGGRRHDRSRANCNLGRDEIRGGTAPSFCRAGGHQCWERIVEPKSASSEIITGSRENAAVYLSYAWGDSYETGLSREDIVDRLYDALLADGYPVRRDKMDLGYKGLISAFMQEIGRGDCIVVIISDKYLKSPFCMFELLEIYRHQEFHDRVFPIVLADARLRTLADRLTYVAHWKAEPDHIKHLIEQVGIDVISASGSFQEYEKYREITHNADKLLTYLADINSQTPQMLAANDFETLRRAIDARLRQVAQRVSTKM